MMDVDRTAVPIVVFDAVGTLITPRPAAHEVYYRVGRRHGSQLTAQAVRGRFQQLLADADAGHPPDWTTSPAQERDRWRQLVACVFAELPTAEQTIFPALWEYFAQPTHWHVYADVAPLWRRLLDSGTRIGIASNFDDRLETLCRQLMPLSAADFVFHSAQLGVRKPGAAFFDAVRRRLGVPPASLMMVGDNLAADYHGARQAGWRAVWLDRSGSQTSHGPHRITSLAQLPDVLLAE